MNSPTGVSIDRGMRLLRSGLWCGALGNLLLGLVLIVSPEILRLPPVAPFYSALIVVLLTILAALAVTVAYAPPGNRRSIRWIALGHLTIGLLAATFAASYAFDLTLIAVLELLIAGAIYFGLKLARL